MFVGIVEGSIGWLHVLVTLVALVVVGPVSGLTAAKIADQATGTAGLMVTMLVVLATLANLLLGLGAETTWFKTGTLVLTVPSILWIPLRNSRTQSPPV